MDLHSVQVLHLADFHVSGIIHSRKERLKIAVKGPASSAGLRFVEAPGQQCYRKVVDVMIIPTMHRICFNSKVKECSCCTNNTSYLSYCLQTRHVCTFASSKVNDEIYFSFENERLPLQLVTIIRFVRCAISTF